MTREECEIETSKAIMEMRNHIAELKEKVSFLEDKRSFTEVFAVVKYKIAHDLPMMTAREELMEDFVKEWAEDFGFESVN